MGLRSAVSKSVFRRRLDAHQPGGEGDDVLRRRRHVVAHVPDAAEAPCGEEGRGSGDVGDVDAVEDLSRLDHTARRALLELAKRVAPGP